MLWSNECKVQGKMSSHILKKSPIALTYSRIVEGEFESKRSFMFLTSASSISEFDTLEEPVHESQPLNVAGLLLVWNKIANLFS